MKHAKKLIIILLIILTACTTNNSSLSPQNDKPAPFNENIIEKDVIKEQQTTNIKEFNIEAFQFSYMPSEIRVKQGDKVRITLSTRDVSHSLSIKDYEINIPAAPNTPGVKEFVANKVGTFIWRCRTPCGISHQEMIGKLIVD